jgi:hypothetical protein
LTKLKGLCHFFINFSLSSSLPKSIGALGRNFYDIQDLVGGNDFVSLFILLAPQGFPAGKYPYGPPFNQRDTNFPLYPGRIEGALFQRKSSFSNGNIHTFLFSIDG